MGGVRNDGQARRLFLQVERQPADADRIAMFERAGLTRAKASTIQAGSVGTVEIFDHDLVVE